VLDDAEQYDTEWWCNYHRESAKWLAIRMRQLLDGEDVKGIVEASLPAFLAEYCRPSKYGFIEAKEEE